MCRDVFACMYICVFTLCVYGIFKGKKEGVRSPRIRLIDSSKPQYRCWESNSNLLEEQAVHLTVEPSFHASSYSKFFFPKYTHIL